jgi:hypothetical protein
MRLWWHMVSHAVATQHQVARAYAEARREPLKLDKYIARVTGGTRRGFDPIAVGVFLHTADGEVQIGEYERNYASMFDTFYPFTRGERELALYSQDYTATRVMELPSCVDLGGEEQNSFGFCPTQYYVPQYLTCGSDREHIRDEAALAEWTGVFNLDVAGLLPLLNYWPFGFVAGVCLGR